LMESSKGLNITISRRHDSHGQEVDLIWWVLFGGAVLIQAVPVRQNSEPWIETIRTWVLLAPYYVAFVAVAIRHFKAAFEKDVLTVHESHFSLHKNILWWHWTLSVPVKDVRNLRVNKRWPDGLVKNIAFDCRGQTYTFGDRVLQDEAQQIMGELGKHLRCRC
jgi:hypothetical protein